MYLFCLERYFYFSSKPCFTELLKETRESLKNKEKEVEQLKGKIFRHLLEQLLSQSLCMRLIIYFQINNNNDDNNNGVSLM